MRLLYPGDYVVKPHQAAWRRWQGKVLFSFAGTVYARIEEQPHGGVEVAPLLECMPRVVNTFLDLDPQDALLRLRLAGWQGKDLATVCDDVLRRQWVRCVCQVGEYEVANRPGVTQTQERWAIRRWATMWRPLRDEDGAFDEAVALLTPAMPKLEAALQGAIDAP